MTGRHNNPPPHLLAAYGCTKEQWLEMRDYGVRMVAAGGSKDCTPLRAFQHQRFRAGKRGIEWQLTLPEWWAIWKASGHWEDRGKTRLGYQMCRKGDKGPYAVGNVYIGPAVANLSAATKR